MGPRSLAVIHCEQAVAWQPKRAAYFAEGFRKAGIPYQITDSRVRLDEGFPVLLGTTFWREIERDGGEYLLVDRCSFGDTEKFVSLVWNNHGRRGDHRVPTGTPAWRWERYGVPVRPWRTYGTRRILCGQTETYSPHWRSPEDWYDSVPRATHFRPHPAGGNPTGLPVAVGFDDCGAAIVLNSSVGVAAVLEGVPTITMDEGSMAWPVTGHTIADVCTPDREAWCHFMAWTQWSDDEIREGLPWAYHL